jgi:hypothetical protein
MKVIKNLTGMNLNNFRKCENPARGYRSQLNKYATYLTSRWGNLFNGDTVLDTDTMFRLFIVSTIVISLLATVLIAWAVEIWTA